MHQERARIEMLDWFIARISDVIRQYQISHEDKRLIYRCERALQLISEKLHNAGLSRIPRVENLVHFIEGYTHLFDETEIVIVSDEPGLKDELQIPPMVFFKSDMESDHGASVGATPHLPQGSILVGREKGQMKPTVLKIEQHRKQRPAWFWFWLWPARLRLAHDGMAWLATSAAGEGHRGATVATTRCSVTAGPEL